MDSRDEKIKYWKLNGLRVWTIIGLVAIFLGILKVFDMISIGVCTIVVTTVIVFSAHGVVNRFEKIGLPRIVGTIITFLIGFVIIALVLVLMVPALVEQGTALAHQVPYYFNRVSNFGRTYIVGDGGLITTQQFYDIVAKAQDWFTSNAANLAQQATTGALGIGTSLGNAGMVAFVSIIASLWILIDLPKISREVKGLFSEHTKNNLSVIARSLGDAFYGWGKATLICMALNGFFCGVGFIVGGVPYPTMLGLVCGIFYIVPYVGPVIFYIICALVGLTKSLTCAVIAIIVIFIVNTIVCNVVSPKLMSTSVNVHPAITLVAILIGSGIGGILGMLIAVPLVAAVQAIFSTFYEANTGRSLYTEDGALFKKAQAPLGDAAKGVTSAMERIKLNKK